MKPLILAAALAIGALAGCSRSTARADAGCPPGQVVPPATGACYWTCGSTYCYATPGAVGQSPCWCMDAGSAPADAGQATISDGGPAPDAIWSTTLPPSGTPEFVLLPANSFNVYAEGGPIFHVERSGVFVFDVDAGVAGAMFARSFNAILAQGGCHLVCGGTP